ncbi:TPA: MBL fold metallo-hydrolase [Clostridioides difficile]|uniref:MBL fold metallo-hydrolase n=2 Tax=Clostridioides difficile TaxID=1496 RepID=UPI000BB1B567|nr:metallohydrolase [Clostridioides difficile]MBH7212350.1 metallohydrolase [Clostridioides difficile]PBG95717.1 metallohydrolase [Clostridioides difficile]VHY65932.1 metallo-hydrolase/oxidoreductase [Clostridioides difficile]VHY71931.1 metallo-hydrolase/oxidoreductase [Clostridioides difficile]HBF4427618.1 metallohydrolase [Clostridioides difficile]
MKLKIVGSGGMSIIPSSFCKCKICEEARQKGGRYERLGPSLYIDDIKMLIDTPEDIAVACNRQKISEVKHISISHHDPDHVKGIRIVEKIGCDFITGENNPIGFYALPEVIEDINQTNLDCLKYYGDVINCISINETSHVKINNFDIDLINNNPDRNITFYVIKENEKKVIYACCNPKPFTHSDMYFDADILIISLVSDDGILNDGTKLKDTPFKDEIFTLDEIVEIKNYYRIKKIIVTHIDEIWGKSYGYYSELEKKLDNIYFAYDGMEIIV